MRFKDRFYTLLSTIREFNSVWRNVASKHQPKSTELSGSRMNWFGGWEYLELYIWILEIVSHRRVIFVANLSSIAQYSIYFITPLLGHSVRQSFSKSPTCSSRYQVLSLDVCTVQLKLQTCSQRAVMHWIEDCDRDNAMGTYIWEQYILVELWKVSVWKRGRWKDRDLSSLWKYGVLYTIRLYFKLENEWWIRSSFNLEWFFQDWQPVSKWFSKHLFILLRLYLKHIFRCQVFYLYCLP